MRHAARLGDAVFLEQGFFSGHYVYGTAVKNKDGFAGGLRFRSFAGTTTDEFSRELISRFTPLTRRACTLKPTAAGLRLFEKKGRMPHETVN
ncbi:MAG: hypothetical protein ACK5NY_06410 [Burkholderiaceae bacterium]|jgi:hypothetical protein